jgi:predicted GH43/DUF377 family glycosyl hydrolase
MLVLTLLPAPAAAQSEPASPELWLKYSGNPVLGPGTAGSFDSMNVISNSVLKADGRYLLYYSGDAGSGYKIGLATSSDGRLFTRYAGNPIITMGSNASVILDGMNFRMWYVGADGLRHATSDDGRFWVDNSQNPIMGNSPQDAWDHTLRNVNVIRDGDIYRMWYSAGNETNVRIGYATSPDGLEWTRYAQNPVLVQEQSWETARVHAPCVLRVSGQYQMWYSASTASATRMCYASSPDGITWTKSPGNPLMPSSLAWEAQSKMHPAVLFDGRDYRMWYTGVDYAGKAQIGCADSTATGPYAPVPLAPGDRAWANLSTPAFSWSFGSGPAGQSAFHFQLDDSLDFGSTVVDTGSLPSQERAFNLTETLADGTYFWRVRAWDGLGDGSAWSDIWTTRIDATAPAVRSLSINGGAEFTVNQSASVELNASDPKPGSGLASMRWSANGDGWTAWEPCRANFTVDLSGPDRRWNISVEVRDAVDNTAPAVNASILVDRTPPSAPVLSINNGSAYTAGLAVQLSVTGMDPSPGTGSSEMAFSGDGVIWTPWEPYGAVRAYNLTGGDGPKTVHARVRDRAGNAGLPANASIVLDTTPPSTSLLRIPAISEETNFTVSWVSLDALSGVAVFDVEYREAGGPWTAWLNGTDQTQAIFSGRDGGTYSFRSRAVDKVGNIEPFPQTATLSVKVEVPRPQVAILDPPSQKVIRAKYLVGGTSSHTKFGRAVTLVEVSIDDGPWTPAVGTLSWTYTLDTTKLKNGLHNVTARSFDGAVYSDTVVIPFKVSNGRETPPMDILPVVVVVVLIVAAGVSASVFVLRQKGPKDPPGSPAPPPPDA